MQRMNEVSHLRRHKQHLRSSMGSADDQLRSLYGAVDNFFRYR
jgi:hypothetical protein